MSTAAATKNVHAWGGRDFTPPADATPIASIPHADPARGEVTLYRASGMGYWVVFPGTASGLGSIPAGEPVRTWCPAFYINPKNWGHFRAARCHTEDPRHPWNDDRPRPGYHTCRACGYPAWIELHGSADGACQCCAYHG